MLEKEVKKEVADMAEVVKVVQELQNRVEVLKAQLNESASDAEAKKVDVDVDPWKFWDQWSEDSSDETFLGFVDDGMPQNLVAGKTYGFEIGPVALVGDCLQMLVMILDATEDGRYVYEDRPVGLLLECYKLGSKEFKEMASNVYAGGYGTIIDVRINRISEVRGTIEVKDNEGRFMLDWRKFSPNMTPCSDSFFFCEHIAEKIKNSKVA